MGRPALDVMSDPSPLVCHPWPVARDGMTRALDPVARAAPDDESRRWLNQLRSTGPDRAAAIEALFELLRRGALSEAQRRRGSLPPHVVDDLDDLTRQAADDALVAILGKLDDYRGLSRFTTWAFKFAIFELSTTLRREAWRGRSITIDDAGWDRLGNTMLIDPPAETDGRELLAAVERSVNADLTPRQRAVFTAVVIAKVPVDVVADRHGSTRGAVYKVLHDARRKLRTALEAQGWDVEIAGGEQ